MTHTPLKTLAPDADLQAALELMVGSGVHQLPIVRDQVLVGMHSRADVMRYMQLGAELRRTGAPMPTATSVPSPAATVGG